MSPRAAGFFCISPGAVSYTHLDVYKRQILLLSEIESKKDYQIEFCEVNQVIGEVIELLEPKKSEHTQLVFHPQAYVKPYPCNRNRIKQLLINLVDNAIKNTEVGQVQISCYSSDKELHLEVSDTGIGIKEDALPRIFERFYRIDKGRSRKQGGTGLGLSIVKHIVEMYNEMCIRDSPCSCTNI